MASNASASSSTALPAEAEMSQFFHPFKHFPPEIRHMVWHQAASEPRVIEVAFYQTKVKNRHMTRNTSKTVVPALLHTCSEAREVGLSLYEKFIPTGVFTGTYINWSQDYIYLDCSSSQFVDFERYQARLEVSSGAQKGILPQQCRRLLLGLRLYAPRSSLFALFDSVEEVAVLHRVEPWSYAMDRDRNELSGIIGGDITLAEVDYTIIKSEIVLKHNGSYHWLWSYMDHHRQKWKKVSLVKATRGLHRPLSREENASRRERERQEKLDATAPVKPTRTSFKNWRLQDLGFEAKDRGLSPEGTKSELVARLQEDEQIPYHHALEEYEEVLDQYRKAKESKSVAPS